MHVEVVRTTGQAPAPSRARQASAADLPPAPTKATRIPGRSRKASVRRISSRQLPSQLGSGEDCFQDPAAYGQRLVADLAAEAWVGARIEIADLHPGLNGKIVVEQSAQG